MEQGGTQNDWSQSQWEKMALIMIAKLNYLRTTGHPQWESRYYMWFVVGSLKSVEMRMSLVERLSSNDGFISMDELLGQPKLPSQDWWQHVVFPTRPRRAAAEQRECNVRILCEGQEILLANKVILSAR